MTNAYAYAPSHPIIAICIGTFSKGTLKGTWDAITSNQLFVEWHDLQKSLKERWFSPFFYVSLL